MMTNFEAGDILSPVNPDMFKEWVNLTVLTINAKSKKATVKLENGDVVERFNLSGNCAFAKFKKVGCVEGTEKKPLHDLEKMSDFELNMLAARSFLNYDQIDDKPGNRSAVKWADGANWHTFNPCHIWKDIGPIIEENNISLEFTDACWQWQARAMTSDSVVHSEPNHNPKRAAVIVYLKLKGSTQ